MPPKRATSFALSERAAHRLALIKSHLAASAGVEISASSAMRFCVDRAFQSLGLKAPAEVAPEVATSSLPKKPRKGPSDAA